MNSNETTAAKPAFPVSRALALKTAACAAAVLLMSGCGPGGSSILVDPAELSDLLFELVWPFMKLAALFVLGVPLILAVPFILQIVQKKDQKEN